MTTDSSNSFPAEAPTTLPYATPAVRAGSPTAAAALVSGVGLGLIVLGGCFLIGVLICGDSPRAGAFELSLLAVVLYILAFACFGGAVCLLFIGIRRLIAIMRG